MQTIGAICRVLVVGGSALACSRSSGETPANATSASAFSPAATSAATPPASSETTLAPRGGFDFPATRIDAKGGDFALVPSPSAIQRLSEPGTSYHTLVYSGAHVESVGASESTVRWLTQQRAMVQNSLIIPIPSGETAAVGDVVLTNWASGSGLQRAIVVSGGEPRTPRVRYLDMELENPTGSGTEEDALPANTFHVLRAPGEVGTTLACKRGERVERIILTKAAGERRLGLGFANASRIVDASQCRSLPIVPNVRAGDRVFVPVVGNFVAAKVTRVEAAIGRVWASYEFGAGSRESAVGYPNVAVELPKLDKPSATINTR